MPVYTIIPTGLQLFGRHWYIHCQRYNIHLLKHTPWGESGISGMFNRVYPSHKSPLRSRESGTVLLKPVKLIVNNSGVFQVKVGSNVSSHVPFQIIMVIPQQLSSHPKGGISNIPILVKHRRNSSDRGRPRGQT